MSIDLARFYPVFIAESLEQLDAMEAELLRPDVESADSESINTIFRAAHSIKGGSATFEFNDIANLTHVLETLLDQVRGGDRALDQGLVDLLLDSVDCLRELLLGYQNGEPVSGDRVSDLQQRLDLLGGTEAPQIEQSAEAAAGPRRWAISFKPHAHLLRTGNDPFRMLRELGDLGQLQASIDVSGLPSMADLDPELSYLSWSMELETESPRADIDELFEWVEGDCDLDVTELPDFNQDLQLETSDLHVEDGKLDVGGGKGAAELPRDFPAAGSFAGTSGSIRVDTDKIDQLINLVGELVITESMLRRLVGQDNESEFDPVQETLQVLGRNVRDLQENALKMRMLPMAFCFSRLPRIVREVGRDLGKDAMLELHGEQTEVDKTVLEKLSDPLIHLVRNAIDHGIEPVTERLAAGKPARATISVEVFHRGGNVIVMVRDDGGGLNADRILAKAVEKGVVADGEESGDQAIYDLIFNPGFTTAVSVTEVSGRGVGLDVVRRNIQALGGYVTVESEAGQGTLFTIALPLTLAIIDGQLVRIGTSIYIIPILAIIENTEVDDSRFRTVAGRKSLYRFRDDVVPILDLAELWQLESPSDDARRHLVVVESSGRHVGLIVHELLDQQQAVIKSLETNFRAVSGISGATILGDGKVALILDVPGLVKFVRAEERRAQEAARS